MNLDQEQSFDSEDTQIKVYAELARFEERVESSRVRMRKIINSIHPHIEEDQLDEIFDVESFTYDRCRIVKKPKGVEIELEEYGVQCYVDQSCGMSDDDDWHGSIYIQLKPNRYGKIPF